MRVTEKMFREISTAFWLSASALFLWLLMVSHPKMRKDHGIQPIPDIFLTTNYDHVAQPILF